MRRDRVKPKPGHDARVTSGTLPEIALANLVRLGRRLEHIDHEHAVPFDAELRATLFTNQFHGCPLRALTAAVQMIALRLDLVSENFPESAIK